MSDVVTALAEAITEGAGPLAARAYDRILALQQAMAEAHTLCQEGLTDRAAQVLRTALEKTEAGQCQGGNGETMS